MAALRRRRTALLTAISALTLSACGNTLSGTPGASRDAVHAAAANLPSRYTYVLTSTCGERALIGRYRIAVDGAAATGEPLGPDSNQDVTHYPAITELLAEVDTAGPDAVIEFQADAAGLPASLTVDPVPNAIDDEACYTFTDIRPGAPRESPGTAQGHPLGRTTYRPDDHGPHAKL
ncbi:hypothetical protein GCM10010168_46850 [Actinoplanes ianthinogenes]|uniref:Lipoprotein n=1 Tax=Actinoplanes ianthinogenes TaxID=122358 RepID=A0ABN6C8H7_9ACTN|nr:hypothetical protein [Actinoplanes ianthinogenes]BCJ41016.1 hypothetical protein Aiant_16730 [Actinoplanes ianthinogenes]GGR23491.1 hypothetical protein GCM10010168_46850 [Actinoplanes ianthinogenes]